MFGDKLTNFETGTVAPIFDPGIVLMDKDFFSALSIFGNNYTFAVVVPIVIDYWVVVSVIRPANCLTAASLATDNTAC